MIFFAYAFYLNFFLVKNFNKLFKNDMNFKIKKKTSLNLLNRLIFLKIQGVLLIKMIFKCAKTI